MRPRALCLHSFRTNAEIMKAQMQLAAHDQLKVDFAFMDGIHECTAEELERVDPALRAYFPTTEYGPYREWWNARERDLYERYDETVAAVAAKLEEGGYDGVVGFSQGGAVAAAVCALHLTKRRELPGLRWAWFQSTFVPRHKAAAPLFLDLDPSPLKVLTTTHESDPIVPAKATAALADAFHARLVLFPGKAHKLVSLKDPASDPAREVRAFFDGLDDDISP